MSEHISALPGANKPAVLLPPEVNRTSPALVPPPSTEEIKAVDRAFVTEQEKVDAMAGLIGLWLTAPWLADIVADHFRTPPEEDDEEDRKARVEKKRRDCC